MGLDKMSMTSVPPQPTGPFNELFADTISDMNNFTTNDTSFTLPQPLFIPCDNPRNVVSASVAKTVIFVVNVGMLPALVTCGFIANVINMAVFLRQGLSDRMRVCLFSLAVSDAGCLLSILCGKTYALISLVDPVAGNYWEQIHIKLCSRLAFVGLSNTITTIIAVERCFCVLSPLKAAKFFKTKYMVTLIVTIGMYIVAVKYIGLNLKYQTVPVTNALTNTSIFINRLTPIYIRHRTIIEIIYLHMVSVALPCASLIIVIICTVIIIFRLKVTASWRRTSVSNVTSVEKQEALMTRMLVTVCCVYIICMTPSVTRVMLLSRVPGFLSTGYLCNLYMISNNLTVLPEAFNCSANFLIYVKQSSQYRSSLKRLCCWYKRGVKKEESKVTHQLDN